MPRFAANLGWLFPEHEFLDRFRAARETGFRAVEFAAPYRYSAAELAGRLDEHGLECVLFNLPMGDSAKGDFGIACRPGREAEFREGVARALEAVGVGLVLEYINTHDVARFFVPRAAQAARVIAATGDRNLGMQCDLYHTAMMGDDPSLVLTAQRAIIRHIQFADAPGRGEPGTGKLPIAQLFDIIDAGGYGGWVGAEYRPGKATKQTLHWMKR